MLRNILEISQVKDGKEKAGICPLCPALLTLGKLIDVHFWMKYFYVLYIYLIKWKKAELTSLFLM